MLKLPVTLVLTLAFVLSVAQAVNADEFYSVGPGNAVYIAWTQDQSGHLQGQVEVVSIDPNNSTQLKTTNAPFTGTRSGSDVSLTFGMFTAFAGATWTGHVGWGTLSLVIPTNTGVQRFSLNKGSFESFQAAVSKIRGAVATNQVRAGMSTSVQDAAKHLQGAVDSVNDGLSRLRAMFANSPGGGFRAKYAAQWKAMQAAWSKEQAVAEVMPMTCWQKSQVRWQANQVEWELNQFRWLDNQVANAKSAFDSANREVLNGIAELENWAPIYNERSRVYAGFMSQTYNRDAVKYFQPMIASAHTSLSTFNDKWVDFKAYVDGYDFRATGLNEKAKAFPDSIACSG